MKMTSRTAPRTEIKAVLSGVLELPLAPENISTIPLYQVHANLWGTLLRDHGKEGLARIVSRSQDNKRLRLQLLPHVAFSNGRTIHASDVIFSLNRLINRQNRGHFNVRGVIRSINEISDDTVELELYKPTPAVVFLLSIPETGIVPSEICKENGDLKNLSVTSGAYRVEGDPQTDALILVKNANFQDHVPHSPNKVTIFFRRGSDNLVRTFNEKSADFMESYESAGMAALRTLRASPDLELAVTKPSYSTFIINSSKRMLGPERRALGRLLGEMLDYAFDPDLEKRSFEILPPKTFGTLEATSVVISSPRYAEQLPKTVRIRKPSAPSALFESIQHTLLAAGIEVSIISDRAADFDIEVRGQGMNSDFPEIEFFLNMVSPYAFIPASEAEKAFVEEMLHTPLPADRFHKVQRLGREILADGRVVPVLLRSYAHLFRKGIVENWQETTNYDGDVLFYKMGLK